MIKESLSVVLLLVLSTTVHADFLGTINTTRGATPVSEAETFVDLVDTQRSECLVRFKPYTELLFYSKSQNHAFFCGDLATYARTGERICLSQVDLIARIFKYGRSKKIFDIEKTCLPTEIEAINGKPDLARLFSDVANDVEAGQE